MLNLSNSALVRLNGGQFAFFSVAECFYPPFSPGGGAAISELFHINNFLSSSHPRISCAKSLLVPLES